MKFFLKKYYILILAVIIILGIGLRIYEFSDLLIFKSDQARDALIVEQVNLNGLSSLPLTGPQIGGKDFRLGPIFYYFQIISGSIFGFSPESLAYPDLIFGILVIPLLFLLARKFFDMYISLGLTALSSVSLFFVTFSRFAWNPNSLPFFTALFIYSFLSAIEEKSRKRKIYLFLAALSLGIIAQLHLFAILSLGLALVLFLIIFKSLNWKEISFIFLIFVFLHTPLIVNEFKTGGRNTDSFFEAVTDKEAEESKHAFYEKIFRSYQENSRALWISIIGNQNTDIISSKKIDLKCNEECMERLPYSILAMLFFGASLVSLFYSWKTEDDKIGKRNLSFIGLWTISFLIISILIAYHIEIRFYLGVFPLLLILFGLVSRSMLQIFKNIRLEYSVFAIFVFVIFLNLQSTSRYLKELSLSQISNQESSDDLRFGSDSKVTLGQLRNIAQEATNNLNKENILIISGETHYVKALYYLLSVENGFKGCYLRGHKDNVFDSLNQVVIGYNKLDDDIIANDEDGITKFFGTLKASFKKAEAPGSNINLPVECITY